MINNDQKINKSFHTHCVYGKTKSKCAKNREVTEWKFNT